MLQLSTLRKGCSSQVVDVQVDKAMRQQPSAWKPYERSYTENSVLLPFIPRHFYQFRWSLMNRNPLCRRVPQGAYTYGELLVTCAIGAEALWMLLHWAADSAMRVDVTTTGAHACSPPVRAFRTRLTCTCSLQLSTRSVPFRARIARSLRSDPHTSLVYVQHPSTPRPSFATPRFSMRSLISQARLQARSRRCS